MVADGDKHDVAEFRNDSYFISVKPPSKYGLVVCVAVVVNSGL